MKDRECHLASWALRIADRLGRTRMQTTRMIDFDFRIISGGRNSSNVLQLIKMLKWEENYCLRTSCVKEMTGSNSALVTIISDKIISIKKRIVKNNSMMNVNVSLKQRKLNHHLKSLQRSKAIKKYLETDFLTIGSIWWSSSMLNQTWNFHQMKAVNLRVTDGSCPRPAETTHSVGSSNIIWTCAM